MPRLSKAALFLTALTAAPALAASALAGPTPRPANAYLYIGWPGDGQVIREQPFRLWFGLRNMGIAPAGAEKEHTGHHHLIIDAELPPMDEEIPANKNYRHFGAGQSEIMLELPPGRHTLQLLFADHNHVPHNPPLVSRKVTVTVK